MKAPPVICEPLIKAVSWNNTPEIIHQWFAFNTDLRLHAKQIEPPPAGFGDINVDYFHEK